MRLARDYLLHNLLLYTYYCFNLAQFDPWFNFRATQYLHDNGWAKFANWYDYKVWYPLGRPVSCLPCIFNNGHPYHVYSMTH